MADFEHYAASTWNWFMRELEASIHERIQNLCSVGDDFARESRLREAAAAYWEAWDLLPEPKTDWNAATWILVAIGDANYLEGDFEAGRDSLSHAMHCPDAIGNPFIHLRLGQCQYELGNRQRAADELIRAYMGAGPEIFRNQDPKYLDFLQTQAKDVERPKKSFWQFWKPN